MLAITGSSGLLGSRLVLECMNRHIPFRALIRGRRMPFMMSLGLDPSSIAEADVLDMPGLLKAFEGVSTVVHCAARVSFSPSDEKKIYRVNVEGTSNVVDACIRQGVSRLIHI